MWNILFYSYWVINIIENNTGQYYFDSYLKQNRFQFKNTASSLINFCLSEKEQRPHFHNVFCIEKKKNTILNSFKIHTCNMTNHSNKNHRKIAVKSQ